jgi:hypothetical protein
MVPRPAVLSDGDRIFGSGWSCMSRIIVTTRDGEVISDLEVIGNDQIGGQVATWVHSLPNLPIYVEGILLSDELRQEILRSMAQAGQQGGWQAPAPAPPSPRAERIGPITPEEFTAFNHLLGQAADEILQAHVNVLQQAQSIAAWQIGLCSRMSETMLERDRSAADEAARQRKMTHQSLRDIDLLDRSIKVQEVTDLFQEISRRGVAANARMTAPSRGSSPMDWINAIATVVGVGKQGEPKPGESK